MTRPPFGLAGFANLLLLLVYPASWMAPLAEAGVVSWFSGEEITILRGIADLWQVDAALAALVALFAIVIPYGKTLALSAIHFGLIGAGAARWLALIGKLSMADVFLIALYIVVVKGVGIGHVTTAWGLWLFTAAVLTSIWVAAVTERRAPPVGPPGGPGRAPEGG